MNTSSHSPLALFHNVVDTRNSIKELLDNPDKLDSYLRHTGFSEAQIEQVSAVLRGNNRDALTTIAKVAIHSAIFDLFVYIDERREANIGGSQSVSEYFANIPDDVCGQLHDLFSEYWYDQMS